ncbi:MAG: hypothetical protein R2795_06720 [Saprospiraceae bacterium]
MTARGDLAVGSRLRRLAEAQEQILWFCEAAYIPNNMGYSSAGISGQGGLATRAEVTDAAMASRTECVMLNKGLL